MKKFDLKSIFFALAILASLTLSQNVNALDIPKPTYGSCAVFLSRFGIGRPAVNLYSLISRQFQDRFTPKELDLILIENGRGLINQSAYLINYLLIQIPELNFEQLQAVLKVYANFRVEPKLNISAIQQGLSLASIVAKDSSELKEFRPALIAFSEPDSFYLNEFYWKVHNQTLFDRLAAALNRLTNRTPEQNLVLERVNIICGQKNLGPVLVKSIKTEPSEIFFDIPTSPKDGDLWTDPFSGIKYIYKLGPWLGRWKTVKR